jgi:hypothetical protein
LPASNVDPLRKVQSVRRRDSPDQLAAPLLLVLVLAMSASNRLRICVGLMLMSAIGAKLTPIYYKGGGPQLNDIVTGHIDVYCGPATRPTPTPYIQAGTIPASRTPAKGHLEQCRFSPRDWLPSGLIAIDVPPARLPFVRPSPLSKRFERTPPSCGGDPLQRHKAANVVGQVLQANLGARPHDADRAMQRPCRSRRGRAAPPDGTVVGSGKSNGGDHVRYAASIK